MSGNGVDFQAMYDMIVQMARGQEQLQRAVAGLQLAVIALQTDVRELKVRVGHLEQSHALMRAELAQYHASVIGHGILITELDERVRRLEEHLDLKPAA